MLNPIGRLASADGRVPILHLSGDFPDALQAAKTPVIRTLTELVCDRFDQRVISINRTAPSWQGMLRSGGLRPKLEVEVVADGDLTTLRYRAPGKGMYHLTMLEQLGDWLVDRIETQAVRPALLVGHKLTIEGIAIARAAERLRLPYALSLQGGTDAKIVAARPDLRPALARIYHGAAIVFPFAPWTSDFMNDTLGRRIGPTIVLPCPTLADRVRTPEAGGDGLVAVFQLQSHRRKNARRLIAAARLAAKAEPSLRIAIVGGGSASDVARMRSLARGSPGITLEGAMPHAAISDRIHAASGFALPSLRDSFGLVFVEALFAGTPILYPAGTAVDGYFDGLSFALPVDSRDVQSISDGMVRLVREEAPMKVALARWQQSGAARRFQRSAIGQAFGSGLMAAIQPSSAR